MNSYAISNDQVCATQSKMQTVTVIVVTLERPSYVERCLECLAKQTRMPEQIIIVDASRDDLTREVVTKFPGVLYLRNENGVGRMTRSRNIGLASATGDIIAFLDDDSFAHEDWLENLVSSYRDATVGAVGGRALNNQPNEETTGVDKIGQFTADGEISGYFAADPGRTIEVDHVMGCNMSFRRSTIQRLGGFREDYPGISGLCEDTDMSVRVRKLGLKILFNPAAQVVHLGAPQVLGRRFDVRWTYYNTRNTMCLLIRNFGYSSAKSIRFPFRALSRTTLNSIRQIASGFARILAAGIGLAAGLVAGTVLLARTGSSPVRRDPEAVLLSGKLSYEIDRSDQSVSTSVR